MPSQGEPPQRPRKFRELPKFSLPALTLLQRRVFPAIVVALGIIVLFPTPLMADVLIGWFAIMEMSMVLLLIPVILIESVVLRFRLKLGWSRALGVSALANLVSTVAGIVALEAVYANRLPSFHISGTGALLPFLILLGPLFLVSWLIEYFVAWLMLRPKRSPAAVSSSRPAPVDSVPTASRPAKRATDDLIQRMLEANVASYLFLAVIGGWLVLNDHGAGGSRQASAVGSLRTINTSEVTYSSTYTTGFSATLAALDGTSAVGTAESAGLIDSVLGSGVKSNYRFFYTPGSKKGMIISYTITASPIEGTGHGNFYFTDQSGVIRMNNTQPATATDSPLAG